MLRVYAGLLSVIGVFVNPSWAHDVSASTVIVHIQDSKVEILQTTPLETAAQAASSAAGVDLKPENSEDILEVIGQTWHISGVKAACALERQAYRLQHHETEIQARYLFVCDATDPPQRLEANWLVDTPPDHFLIFTIATAGLSKTVIFEHQELSLDISQLH